VNLEELTAAEPFNVLNTHSISHSIKTKILIQSGGYGEWILHLQCNNSEKNNVLFIIRFSDVAENLLKWNTAVPPIENVIEIT